MLQIEVKLKGVEALTKSQVINALKAANMVTGKYFRTEMLPARFTIEGGRRLKYTPRKGEFRIGLAYGGKLRVKGREKLLAVRNSEKLPLVASGEGRREALSRPTHVKVTRDKIVIPLPKKFNLRNPKSRVNMSDEIRRVTNREASVLTKVLVAQLEHELGKVAGVTRFRRVEFAKISNAE